MKQENTDLPQTSYKSPEIGHAEMVYNPQTMKSKFVAYKDGKISTLEKITLDEKRSIVPLNANDDRVKLGVVKFPDQATEYGPVLDLYLEVKEFIKKYVYLPERFLTVSSTYVLMSWIYDQFQVIPYLRVIGDYGTGKSRFLEVVGSVCYKPIAFMGSASTSSIFRTIHDINGTMLLDEADFRESETFSEIVRILNAGHRKGGAVQRTQMNPKNNSYDIKTFSVYGPKIIGSREKWNDEALESRCLTQYMISNPESTSPIHLPDTFDTEALKLRNKLLMFRFHNLEKININEEWVSELKVMRMRQTVLALIATAKIIEDDTIVDHIIKFTKTCELDLIRAQTVSDEADLLICIGKLLGKEDDQDKKIYMRDVANQYNTDFGDGNLDYSESPNRLNISPKKAGHIINKKLHIRTSRNSGGVFIPTKQEKEKINSLLSRYGITEKMLSTTK